MPYTAFSIFAKSLIYTNYLTSIGIVTYLFRKIWASILKIIISK